ncbi:hypothetical protein EK21DRAFT_103882 [Setomelanomma holmii]|uniref:Uncharacterized protein n=1 Tax=Setomelanomma holmii TaxID=210430 RepID=A0A9P4GZ08_9PLEO|nr:hypothetical protein EK21DRAFT_103882 [Setomelanomma holmii]
MNNSAALAGSRASSDSHAADSNRKYTFIFKIHRTMRYRYAPVLILTVAIYWTLVAVLQFLLFKSQRNDGIIFALKINHLPLSQTFFCTSFGVVLVAWGLVPVQAGIFSTQTITQNISLPFERSSAFIPVSQQPSELTLRLAQSTYGIAVLNETLTQYMAKNYILAPVRPSLESEDNTSSGGNWTFPTTMYSLELYCEPASFSPNGGFDGLIANSSNGCSFTMGLTGNNTIGENSQIDQPTFDAEQFTAMYAGYSNPRGFADYALVGECPTTSNSTFYAAVARNKAKAKTSPTNVTAIFCWPTYYQEEVIATVDSRTLIPMRVDAIGPKQPLAPNVLTSGPVGAGRIQPMVGLSLAVGNRPIEDYLDWKVLAQSYAAAYRLTFARAMRDVLDVDFRNVENVTGYTQFTIEAVQLEPVFVYIVEGLLGIVSLAIIALLYLTCTRKRNLASNPSTIAAVMSIVADNQPLLTDVEGYDCCTMEEMQKHVEDKRYKLVHDGSGSGLVEVSGSPALNGQIQAVSPLNRRQRTTTDIAKPVRPKEFSLWMAIPFVSLFITLTITLAVVFAKARSQGLPLPSSNTIVQNILENYIPTAIATLIEPMWVLINRPLCMLQPIEELQKCNAPAKRSIDLDYSSLPPQLVVFQALRSKHFVLAAVCTMALLANVLAVAFAGIFNQATIDMRHPLTFKTLLDLKFVPINGSIGPIAGQAFASMQAHVLIADSYFRQGTPLPAWTDESMFYLPFSIDGANSTATGRIEAKTRAFGAKLECTNLASDKNFQAALLKRTEEDTTNFPSINITLPGTNVQCTRFDTFMGRTPVESEVDACMGTVVLGWLRDRNGTCAPVRNVKLNEQNSAFVSCRPKLMTGTATIRVDASGRLQDKAKDIVLEDAPDDTFTNGPAGLLGQSNMYLFKKDSAGWHNDSFADDFNNYFMRRVSNSSRLTDPTKPPPSFSDIEGPLSQSYSLLLAIWMGTNKDKLLTAYEAGSSPALKGERIVLERRLFVSMPMFIISEAILCTYALVAMMIYVRRPGQYLPRMPTSIASVIALFAASAAIMNMPNTSHLDRKGRARHLEKVNARYGYGSFIGGGDGRVHVGIEKTPFVRVRSKTTWLEKKISLFRKGSSD